MLFRILYLVNETVIAIECECGIFLFFINDLKNFWLYYNECCGSVIVSVCRPIGNFSTIIGTLFIRSLKKHEHLCGLSINF